MQDTSETFAEMGRIVERGSKIMETVKDCPIIPEEHQKLLRELTQAAMVQLLIEQDLDAFQQTILANLAVAYQLGRQESGGFWE